MSTSDSEKPMKTARGGFGFQPRPRKKVLVSSTQAGRTDQDLVNDFIAQRGVTVCEPRFAEGSRPTSGDYDF